MKSLIKKILSKFDLRLVKISKNENVNDVLKFLLSKLDIDAVFDVGANEGQFAKKLRNLGYKEEIISFEPLKKVFNLLEKNSSNDKKWQAMNIAIGDQDGETTINESNYSLSSSILPMSKLHLEAKENSNYIGKQKVSIKKIDTVIDSENLIKNNLFLKIDTQGFEYQVINGSIKNLKNIRAILCELTLVELYEGQKLWLDIVELLTANNFEIWSLEKGFQNSKNKQILQIDCIFLNKEFKQKL